MPFHCQFFTGLFFFFFALIPSHTFSKIPENLLQLFSGGLCVSHEQLFSYISSFDQGVLYMLQLFH